jgi:hypothetical protein
MANDPQKPRPWPRICPHCGRAIQRLAIKPRDLGLLLNALIYRVPIETQITELWIEAARKHCRMKPERLAELRQGDHARHWPRMIERRAARLAFFRTHGKAPSPGTPLLPGEPGHDSQLAGLRRYRKGGLAKLKAKWRKHPVTTATKLMNRHQILHRLDSKLQKAEAFKDNFAWDLLCADGGKLTLAEYDALRYLTLGDDAFPNRFRQPTP